MPSTIAAGTTAGTAIAITGDTTGNLAFQTNGTTTAMTIDTSQNVGIGTTNPSVFSSTTNLAVGTGSSTASLTVFTGTAQTGAVYFADGTSGADRYRGAIEYTHSNNALLFTTDASERMRITSTGKLIVGGTSLYYPNNSSGGSFQGNQTGGGDPVCEMVNTNSTSSSDGSPVLYCSKVSSTTNSNARFIQFAANGSATAMGGIVGNGASNVQFASLSDAREKTNIQPINGSLGKINALKPVEFDWIADGTHVNAGFVAQDVEQVFPEFVVENMANEGDEPRLGLTGGMTGGIIPHLVKAIQELKAELDATKAEVAALKGA